MIKYSKLAKSRILLELTSRSPKRKAEFKKKKAVAMRRIIQKTKFLLSRLNFFDLAVILSILLIVCFFVYNRLQRQSTWVNIRISVENADWWYRGSPPFYWYAKDLQVGDTLLDSFGKPVAEIANIDNYDEGGPYRNVYVDLKVRVDHDRKKNQYLYEFKPLVVGSNVLFNFSSGQLRGVIVRLGEQNIDYFYKTIRVEKKKVNVGLASVVKSGEKSYDSQGNLVAEIISVESRPHQYYEFSDIRGRNIAVYDPQFRDLEVELRVKGFNELGVNYFINKAALKVGNRIWFQFPGFALEDTEITELVD